MSDVYLDIWYDDDQYVAYNGLGQKWVNILGRVSPTKQVAQLDYALNDGDWQPLSFGPDYRRLAGHGDFNIEVAYRELRPDENHVRIRVQTQDNTSVEKLIRLHNGGVTTAPLPQKVRWSTSKHIQQQAQVIDGLWHVHNGRLWTAEAGYDRAVAVGSMDLESYEVRVPVALYGFAAGGSAPMSGGYGIGIALHWQGHVDWGSDAFSSGQPRHGYEPVGAMLWYGWDRRYDFRLRLEGHDASTPLGLDSSSYQMRYGQDYMLCFRVVNRPQQTSHYALKAWSTQEREPDHWLIEANGSVGELTAGSALLLSHHAVCSFGNAQIIPIS